jgi:hypothetical protein
MDLAGADPVLIRSLEAWSKFGPHPGAGTRLKEQLAARARLARDAVALAVPAFGAAAGADLLDDFEQHAQAHIAELGRLLDGGAVRDFNFVRVYARDLAAQRFALEAALQAYRCLPALFLRWLDGANLTPKARGRKMAHAALAELVAQYTSAISIVFAAAYAAQATAFAEAEGDRRAELLAILVGGFDEADTRIVRLLKHAGYLEQRLRFCVALARATDPLEMENTARAKRIADAVVECVAPLAVRVLVGVRGNLVMAVFSDIRRVSGWTAPQASVAERVRERLLGLGPSVLVGLSGDQPSPHLIPRGLHEATVALDFATVSERVTAFYSLSLRRLLIHRGVDYAQSALPAWFGALCEANARSQGQLARTLRAFADADMSVQGAARSLRVHANTVYGRLQRIEEITSLNAQRYHDLSNLLLALDCGRL